MRTKELITGMRIFFIDKLQ